MGTEELNTERRMKLYEDSKWEDEFEMTPIIKDV